jgi:hypothetical protein
MSFVAYSTVLDKLERGCDFELEDLTIAELEEIVSIGEAFRVRGKMGARTYKRLLIKHIRDRLNKINTTTSDQKSQGLLRGERKTINSRVKSSAVNLVG